MASFENHLVKVKENLEFLEEINGKSRFFDWQVTTCFYVAVHLVNAHIAKMGNLHYKSHEQVKQAINPDNPLSVCKIPEDIYDTYIGLEKLSRRARYLCNDAGENDQTAAFITYEKHVSKSIKKLNLIMTYFNRLYQIDLKKVSITCPKIKAELKMSIEYFSV